MSTINFPSSQSSEVRNLSIQHSEHSFKTNNDSRTVWIHSSIDRIRSRDSVGMAIPTKAHSVENGCVCRVSGGFEHSINRNERFNTVLFLSARNLGDEI